MVTGIVAAILALLTSALSTVQAPTGSFPTPDPQPQAIERPASIREEIATLRQAIRDLVALHASGREQIPGGFELTPPEMPFQSNSEAAPEDGCRPAGDRRGLPPLPGGQGLGVDQPGRSRYLRPAALRRRPMTAPSGRLLSGCKYSGTNFGTEAGTVDLCLL